MPEDENLPEDQEEEQNQIEETTAVAEQAQVGDEQNVEGPAEEDAAALQPLVVANFPGQAQFEKQEDLEQKIEALNRIENRTPQQEQNLADLQGDLETLREEMLTELNDEIGAITDHQLDVRLREEEWCDAVAELEENPESPDLQVAVEDALEALEEAEGLVENSQSIIDLYAPLFEEPVQLQANQYNENRWRKLKNTRIDGFGQIFEFVDNSIGHAQPGVPLNVTIRVYQSANAARQAEKIEIVDNAKGIERDILPDALSPHQLAGEHDDVDESEHGVGMKHALAGIANTHLIETRSYGTQRVDMIRTEQLESIVNGLDAQIPSRLGLIDNRYTHGTKFTLTNLSSKGSKLAHLWDGGRIDYLEDLRLKLGQRYRRKLVAGGVFGDEDQLKTGITIERYRHDGGMVDGYPKYVEKISPLYYYDPMRMDDRSAIIRAEGIHGDGWSATLTLGLAPKSDEDWARLGPAYNDPQHPRRRENDPYNVEVDKRGLDIVYGGLVIEPYWFGDKKGDLQVTSDNVNTRIRGEIILGQGFESETVKTRVQRNANWESMVEQVNLKLTAYEYEGEEINLYQEYLKWKSPNRGIPEKKIENALMDRFHQDMNQPQKKRVYTGFPVVKDVLRQARTSYGDVDILINPGYRFAQVCVEVKAEEVRALDVYQLKMYMDATGARYGIIASPKELSTGAKQAIKNLGKKGIPFYRRYYIQVARTMHEGYDTDFDESERNE